MTVNKYKDYLKSWAYKNFSGQQRLFPASSIVPKNTLIELDETPIIDEVILLLSIKHRLFLS